MLICKVIGNVWATRKLDSMKGQKFLIVQQIDLEDKYIGNPFLAVDNIGAGTGEKVIVTQGSSARIATEEKLPTDAAVIGIIDSMEEG